MIEPIPGTSDPLDGGVLITEKTLLTIDRNGMTIIFDNGMLDGVMLFTPVKPSFTPADFFRSFGFSHFPDILLHLSLTAFSIIPERVR